MLTSIIWFITHPVCALDVILCIIGAIYAARVARMTGEAYFIAGIGTAHAILVLATGMATSLLLLTRDPSYSGIPTCLAVIHGTAYAVHAMLFRTYGNEWSSNAFFRARLLQPPPNDTSPRGADESADDTDRP